MSRLVGDGVIAKAVKHARFGLERADVERVALDRWKPGHPYFTDTVEVADVLAVTPRRVRQLAASGVVPAVQHDGRWFSRRHQVEVIANAREARKPRGRLGTGTGTGTGTRPRPGHAEVGASRQGCVL